MENNCRQKIRYGIIGCGSIGLVYISELMRCSNSELLAVSDLRMEQLEKAVRQYAIPDVYTNYKEMLIRDDIDAVIVATPDQMHEEHTIVSLESGKHVLCEKPMALTPDECRNMIRISGKTGRKLMIGQVCRYAPGFMLTKKLIDSGQIGELFFVESEYAHDYSNIKGIGSWRTDPEKLRHPVVGGGCHAVDLLRWIVGNPYEVNAYSNRKVLKSWPVDDCTVAIMRFHDDILGKVMVSIGCKRKYTMRSVFYGSKGTIIADNKLPYIIMYKENLNKEHEGQYAGISEQTIEMHLPVKTDSHNLSAETEEFSDMILNNRNVSADGIEGASTVTVCSAIVESAQKGEKILISYDFN
jgi:UDP-N-acetylglucosamine 3-dehydrogenase